MGLVETIYKWFNPDKELPKEVLIPFNALDNIVTIGMLVLFILGIFGLLGWAVHRWSWILRYFE